MIRIDICQIMGLVTVFPQQNHHLYGYTKRPWSPKYTNCVLFQAHQVCSNILQDPSVNRALEIERLLDSSLHSLLRMFYSLIGLPGIPRNEKMPCYHLAYYIHILWSFGAVTYLTWRLERCSRVLFLRSQGVNQDSSDLPAGHTIAPAQDFYSLVVFVGLCCLLWEFMAIALMNVEGSLFNTFLGT